MDNKITKKRLSEYLSYEWILILVIAIAGIIVWELAYTIASVKLTSGQHFKYYYDYTVSSSGQAQLHALFDKHDTFSYDVLKVSYEDLTDDMQILTARLSVQEGDVLITEKIQPAEDATQKVVRVNTMIDSYSIYDLDKMFSDAKGYLAQFLIDGLSKDVEAELVFENLSKDKIEAHFLERMKKDNRFRSDEQKVSGVALEVDRIKRLCKEVADYKIVLSQGEELFYRYTKYSQTLSNLGENDMNRKEYEHFYQRELDQGRENARYGIVVNALTGGEHSPSEFFKTKGQKDAVDVVVTFFDFFDQKKGVEAQPDLQFECITFLNTIVRECSNILN